ncbi:hypothetical protein [Rhizobium leguminosarum]|uniref:hypothetical protein n=1 Tax=Rhizobium leguminosarum TaxID=384 RepID=UPI002E0E37EA|nr:hypothetical protein U8Q02_41450 [Rhizobium leguminosarum]
MKTGTDGSQHGRVVVCGSMAFEREMAHVASLLCDMGVPAISPDFDDPAVIAARSSDVEGYRAYKREVSMRHFNKILDPRTSGVLVANYEKHGKPGYIGPNTFAEISVAFAHGRQIWLLNEVPEHYEDELTAWGAVVVGSNLSAHEWIPRVSPTSIDK